MTNLRFYNTLTRLEEPFVPLDPAHVRMYVCGPTVYDRAHIGNARSAVVYDVMVRLLRHLYPTVTYVRNITDVDDKINKAARERNISIGELTSEVTGWFHDDMDALNVQRPDVEPRATQHIPEMIAMIEALIAKGHAYAAEGHVLFAVESDEYYGCLSRRTKENMIAGARVEVAPYKKYAGDFVLWKPSSQDEPGWESPWGYGRPGWHIECSAMSTKYLGATFDIHGGGADLIFPHHENEIAQSTCAHDDSEYARCWVHNGFLTVNGEKMSKSAGNFVTVHDLLSRGVKGEVIRYALMATHYRKPLDWNEKALEDAQKTLDSWYRVLMCKSSNHEALLAKSTNYYIKTSKGVREQNDVLLPLYSDLNVSSIFAHMNKLRNYITHAENEEDIASAINMMETAGKVLGLLQQSPQDWFKGDSAGAGGADDYIEAKIAERIAAKKARDFAASDRIRDELKADGIVLEDRPDGTTDWRRA